MKCFRCNKEIMEEENYLNIKEIDNRIEVSSDYVHKQCWDNFLKQISSVEESMGIIKGLKSYFIKQGILPKKEYVIK